MQILERFFSSPAQNRGRRPLLYWASGSALILACAVGLLILGFSPASAFDADEAELHLRIVTNLMNRANEAEKAGYATLAARLWKDAHDDAVKYGFSTIAVLTQAKLDGGAAAGVTAAPSSGGTGLSEGTGFEGIEPVPEAKTEPPPEAKTEPLPEASAPTVPEPVDASVPTRTVDDDPTSYFDGEDKLNPVKAEPETTPMPPTPYADAVKVMLDEEKRQEEERKKLEGDGGAEAAPSDPGGVAISVTPTGTPGDLSDIRAKVLKLEGN